MDTDNPSTTPYLPASQRPTSLKDTTAAEQRPREKVLTDGFAGVTEAELLALLVGSGTRGENVVDLCKRVIDDHGGKLYNIARGGIDGLMAHYRGIGRAKAITVMAALELARRYQFEQFEERPRLRSSIDVYRFLRPRMADLDHEELWVVLLNRAKQAVGARRISTGGTSSTVADIKMVLRPAIVAAAEGIVLAHNHPSDNDRPSAQDDQLTRRVRQACQTMGIELVDHLIVCGGGRYYSYCDQGRLD